MLSERDVIGAVSGLRRETLRVWIERGWVAPLPRSGEFRFREVDVARVRLIHEFRSELELDDDALDVVLPLLDQVHGLRRQLRRLAAAVDAQPEEIRRRIVAHLDDSGD